jgi:phosphatidylglycerol:prolipoprotein diacylglycerol transferase
MFPTLLRVGHFRLSTYGLMMMTAFLCGIWLAVRRGRGRGIGKDFVQDLSTVILLASLAGARGLYILTHLEEFRGNWLAVVNPFQPDGGFGIAGLVLLGGVLAAIPATVWYTRRQGQSVLETIDLLSPSLALGMALGRVGCLLNGCCYGKACDLPWAISYPATSHLHELGPVHPTQVYLILGDLLLMAALLWAARRRRFPGQVFALFLVLYAPLRFTVEFLRDYEPSMILGRLGGWDVTTSQVISLAMLATGLVLHALWLRIAGREAAA